MLHLLSNENFMLSIKKSDTTFLIKQTVLLFFCNLFCLILHTVNASQMDQKYRMKTVDISFKILNSFTFLTACRQRGRVVRAP